MTRQREQSTPEQLEVAILGSDDSDPCRWSYATEVWDNAVHDHWHDLIPPHAVIHSLRRDADVYRDLLRTERRAHAALVARHRSLVDALRSALTPNIEEALADA